MAGAGSEMSARNHRPLVSSSSTTSRMPPSVSENHIKKIAILKPQLAKKRPALSDITNQRDGFRAGSRVIGTQSKPIVVPCSAKIAKKKESSAHYHDKGLFGNTLPATLSAKADVIVKYAISPGIDLPTAIAIPAPSIAIMVPRCTSISPNTSVGVQFLWMR